MSRAPRVHIIGGGFSGLMAAFFCRARGCEVAVSEAEHWGGVLSTETSPWGMVEAAANGFLRTDLLTDVARTIGVDLLDPLPGARKRWVANEKPQTRPVSWGALARAASAYAGHRLTGSHLARDGETVTDWGARVLGPAVAERGLRPAVQGVYGYDGSRLSARLIVNPLFAKGRPRRRGFAAPRRGMNEWATKMREFLARNQVRLRAERRTDWPDADHVVLATSAAGKALLLREQSPETADLFASVTCVPMISVSTFWEKSSEDLPGFGVLFHPAHGWATSGVLFNNQIFADRSPHRSERYFFAGAEWQAQTDAELMSVIEAQRARLGWKNQRLGFLVHRWPRVLPHYSLQHEKTLQKLSALAAPGVHFLGPEMGGIGLTSLAENAQQVADRIAGGS